MWELLEGLVHVLQLIVELANPENHGKWYWWLGVIALVVLLFGGCFLLMTASM